MNHSPEIKIGKVTVALADYAVGANAILGIRDSGKTVTAKGIAEQLIDNNIPIFVFDAVGKWRWMKSPADNARGKSYKVVVAGGRQPDLPLTPHSVPEIIRSALKERIPLIIDLYDPKLSKADWRRIVEQAIRLIHYENDGGAVHVFLEEAAEYCPQRIQPGQGEVYAEIEKLVRMGGNASVGITLINQRSQEINKAVLDNCSTALVLGCQVGTNAIDAVGRWIERLDKNTAAEVVESLPRLKSGEAWVWTRKSLDQPTREHMPMCRSFHPDRRTPETVLKALKSSDTREFIERMSASIPKIIEEAKENDPKQLKARILQLEREKQQLTSAKPAPVATKTEHVPALTDHERKRLTALIDSYERLESSCKRIEDGLKDLLTSTQANRAEVTFFKTILSDKLKPSVPAYSTPGSITRASFAPVTPRQLKKIFSPTSENGDITPVAQRILNALAELELLGVAQPVREMVALMSGYTNLASTGYVKATGELRTAGYVDYPNADTVAMTEAGRARAVFPAAPRSSEEIQQRVCNLLGGKASEILRPLIDAYPQPVDRMDVAAAAGYTNLASTGFVKIVGRLRTLGFIDYPNSQTMKATDVLFLQ